MINDYDNNLIFDIGICFWIRLEYSCVYSIWDDKYFFRVKFGVEYSIFFVGVRDIDSLVNICESELENLR